MKPPPEFEEGEEVYDVETILNHRKRGQGYQYFVKWRGYPITDASWEPEHTFSNDDDTLTLLQLSRPSTMKIGVSRSSSLL